MTDKLRWPTNRSSHQWCSVRKRVLRNFAKFTGKHLCQSLFFIKVADLRPATLFKKKTLAQVFSCEFCKVRRTPFSSPFSRRLPPTKLNKFDSIDFIVDLKKSFKGTIHILTVVDNTSKFIKVYALKDRSAITARRFICNYFSVYGILEKI